MTGSEEIAQKYALWFILPRK